MTRERIIFVTNLLSSPLKEKAGRTVDFEASESLAYASGNKRPHRLFIKNVDPPNTKTFYNK
jgi:hypothetical protein